MSTLIAVIIFAAICAIFAVIKISGEKKAEAKRLEKSFEEKKNSPNSVGALGKKKWLYSVSLDSDDCDPAGLKSKRRGSTVTFYKNCVKYDVYDLQQEEDMRVAFVLSRRYKWPKEIVPEENGYSYIERLYALFIDGKKGLDTPPQKIKADRDSVPTSVMKVYDKATKPFSTEAPKSDFIKMTELQAKQQVAMEHEKPKDASVVGRAAAGAVIAGPAGAVVGALSAVDKNNRNKK